MYTDKLSKLIKSTLDSNSSDISAEVTKLQEKLANSKVEIGIGSEEIVKLNQNINNLSDQIKSKKGLHIPQNTLESIKANEEQKNNVESLRKLLSTFGFLAISSNFINLVFTLFTFTKKMQMYDYIKDNPLEFKSFLERLPKDSQYDDSNRFIYKNNKIDSERVIPLVGSLDLLKTISAEELIPFHRFISEMPLLGLHHKTGQKIFNYINDNKKKCFKIKINQKLYHGRKREIHKKPLNIYELFEAPYSFASHGRANMLGVPALYFSDDPFTVVKEARWSETDTPLDGFETKINRTLTMLDIRDNDCTLFSYCYFPHKKPCDISAYIIPNFIADCCRFKGIDGIIYKSVQNKDSTNYVFFKNDKSWFKKFNFFSWDGSLKWVLE